MLFQNLHQIDFSKYDRFFVVGCSFTKWHWATWADIIAKEYPNLTLYNYGKGGQGNTYIHSVLSQIILHHKPTKNDLVAVMWSSFHRDDRYNMYQPEELTSALLQESVPGLPDRIGQCHWRNDCDLIALRYHNEHIHDDRGHLIQNLALIHSASAMLNMGEFDSFQILSIGINNQVCYDPSMVTPVDDVKALYHDLLSEYVVDGDMFDMLMEGKLTPTVTWIPPYRDIDGEQEGDNHPSATKYCYYLREIGIDISEHTVQWAMDIDQRVQQTKWARELEEDPEWQFKPRFKPIL